MKCQHFLFMGKNKHGKKKEFYGEKSFRDDVIAGGDDDASDNDHDDNDEY